MCQTTMEKEMGMAVGWEGVVQIKQFVYLREKRTGLVLTKLIGSTSLIV